MFTAVPVAAIVKAAVAVLSNEIKRKTAGWVIAAILSLVILIAVVICALMSGTADHNAAAVDLTFHGGSISAQAPPEYRQYIEEMSGSFGALDGAVAEITPLMESGSINTTRMKAIFYALFIGTENSNMNFKAFADCAARDGIVSYVKNSGSSGYGYHLATDHGDGMITLYAGLCPFRAGGAAGRCDCRCWQHRAKHR